MTQNIHKTIHSYWAKLDIVQFLDCQEKTWVHLFAFVRRKNKHLSCSCGSSQTGYQKIWSSSSLRNHFPDMNTVPLRRTCALGIQEPIVLGNFGETQLHFQVSKKQLFSFSIRLLQNCDDMPPGRNGANNNSCSITSHCMEYPTKNVCCLMVSADFCLHFTPKRTAPVFCKASFFKGTKTKII